MTLRTFANAVNVVCPGCGRVLDATDSRLKVLQEANNKLKVTPLIPLGTRGKWKGVTYEVVGFQERSITSDGVDYHWYEYLLFNPYAGYRYLTEYSGHWNDVTVCHALPVRSTVSNRKGHYLYAGRSFTQFQTANARTTYILGEFPWQVRIGDPAVAEDFISPPFMLSSEKTEEETTWSLGEYVSGKDIWSAFSLKGSPPDASGVYANQ